jgi:tetratricopeptide (TPR) repeat protein
MNAAALSWLGGWRKFENVRHPYPALASFADTDLDRSLFFGRRAEAENLLNNLLTSDVVLFFGRSGYGKTSLINAGVMAPLRQQGYFPVVCQLAHSLRETPLEWIRARMLEAARDEQVDVELPRDARSLWEFFHQVTFRKDGHRLRPVLVLDQFEELFSRIAVEPQWGPRWQQQFIKELADVIRRRVPEDLKAEYLQTVERLPEESAERQRLVDCLYGSGGPDVKVLIAIREAFLAELGALRMQIPSIFYSAVRLEPLTPECARLAITQPAENARLVGMEPFSFDPRALEELVNFLSLDKRTGKPRTGACIEPAQLQILCYDLSVRRLRTGARVITAEDLRGAKGMRRIITVFYNRLLRRFPRLRPGWSARRWWPSRTNLLLFSRPRKAVRQLCEYGLITAAGFRDSLIIETIQSRFGVAKGDLDKLVNLRLLRAESRLGTIFYELAHDALVEPLRDVRRKRFYAWFAPPAVLVLVLAVIGLINVPEKVQVVSSTRTLYSDSATAKERSAAFQELVRMHKRKDFAGENLAGVRASQLSLFGADLSGANLSEVYFTYVDLEQADLRRANARAATFSGTEFEGARVAEMNIDGARFEGSNWWMAVGWSDQQIDDLVDQYPPEVFMITERYRRGEAARQSVVEDAKGKERGDALNNLAWYRATNGSDLIAAYADIERAIRQGDREHQFHYLDTRGYIRLRLKEYAAAVDDLQKAADILGSEAKRGKRHPEAGSIYYHLGLAYEGIKDLENARAWFAAAEKAGYAPSYERVLTPRLGARKTRDTDQARKYLKALED